MCNSSELHMHYFAFPFLCVFPKVRKANTKFIKCVFASAQNNSAVTEGTFITFDIPVRFENLHRNFKFLWIVMRTSTALNGDECTFMISRWIVFKLRNISDRICRENQNTHNNFFLNHPVCETMLENIVQVDLQATALCMPDIYCKNEDMHSW